ncbi:MAG: ABC transporter ATP-binding protein [Solirubrobacterales bacterium]
MSEPLTLRAVTKRYGERVVVRGVDFALRPGERVALLGHNGAGKTTLMKMALGLAAVTSGDIRVNGHDPTTMPASVRRGIGFLPENVAFDPGMTGREMLSFYAALKHRGAKEVTALLEQVGLAEAAGRRVGTWSKGMRQRLGLAQAVLGTPRLLLLDEPTSGLDPEYRQAFYELLAERARGGTAVLLSSHLLTELEEKTDRVLIVDHGLLIAQGTLEELRVRADRPFGMRVLARPGHDLSAALADLAPRPDGAWLHLACRPADKMAVLRRLAALDGVADIELHPPGLDDLYAHFLGEEAR